MKKLSLSKAKARAWKAFALWVRLRDAKGENVQCVTCGRWKNYKKMQAGHFIPGRHNAILFDERGVNPQCYTCNIVLGGNGPKYYKWMLEHHGQQVIDDLEELDKSTLKYSVEEFLLIEETYTNKLKTLAK